MALGYTFVEALGSVRHVAPEGQGIARIEEIAVPPMAIMHDAREHVDELRAGVLKAGKDLAPVVQGHQKRLEYLARAPLRRQEVIGMAAPRAAAHRLEAFAGADQLGAAVVGTHALHQDGCGDSERLREGDDGLEARRHPAGLEPAQHGAADVGAARDVGEGEVLAFAQATSHAAEISGGVFAAVGRRFERRGLGRRGAARRLDAPAGLAGQLRHCAIRKLICSTVKNHAYIRTWRLRC